MNNSLEWDDLRLVLAVGRTGTLTGAAKALGVSHPTVFRKLRELERRISVELFERTRQGYAPSAAGEEAIAVAGRIETEVHALERQVIGRDLQPSGTVSLTTTDALYHACFAPVLARFCVAFPEIDLDIVLSNSVLDLTEREADIAIRPATAPPDHLVGRRLGVIRQSIYVRRDLLDVPWRESSLGWVGPDRRMGYAALESWMKEESHAENCRMRVNSTPGMLAAVKGGAGLAVLPDYAAADDPHLKRVEAVPRLDVDLWLLTHPTLRRAARIRALMDFVASAAKERFP
ncbi:LysR family transcriptional regulator [uncultured Nitratireductor sp.]|uniref:LysR family transcriptional regulator n=1 Tax=uncultured Nitratireductor sp. TaxID=520953 RepID=UPI0025CD2173|nr:LysR family transcriptional regulator [uncultured Nitratireductor sp.]